jgi:glutathione synthase/RimK-type ligase-like ATP-grasp enzyme
MYKTLVVVDNETQLADMSAFDAVTFERYLADYPKRNERKTRLINLCDTRQYLSRGYYCSLLAEARQHKVLPSVSAINDLRDSDEKTLSLQLSAALAGVPSDKAITLMIFFGQLADSQAIPDERLAKFARQVFDQYPAPILKVSLTPAHKQSPCIVERYAYAQLEGDLKSAFLEQLSSFVENVWRTPTSRKRARWEMAILVNPNEKQPPSDKVAISRFIKAASKVGIHAEALSAEELGPLSQYDALFIRETTAIDHHTYRLARKAEKEGLVVIDDATSILRCCNKVFLHDAFSYNGVPSPKTEVVIAASEADLDAVEQSFGYPLVLKMPEGSFSKGVYKVKDRAELKERLEELFVDTALVLAQEYLYTDYDWRIGVLNGRAIYACKYMMARNHWQIYNHESKRFNSGGFETLPTFEVPRAVLQAALKACDMIGNGLYGVDIKQKDNQVYVIEVNDNPSIDHKVEDVYLGNELYMVIMTEFANRLENRGR